MKNNITVTNTYFHFTGWVDSSTFRSIQKACEILNQKKFYFKRNQRDLSINQGFTRGTSMSLSHYYVNMICFTETPIQFLKETILSRGGFCIGMKKEWLLRCGGQSVIYVSSKNPNDYGRALIELHSLINKPEMADTTSQDELKRISNVITSLLGATEDEGFNHEREWRIIKNELNDFIPNNFVEFLVNDIGAIYCDDDLIPDLLKGIESHTEFDLLKALIVPVSELDGL